VAANEGDRVTVCLLYSVENTEDTIDAETYDRALNDAADATAEGGEVRRLTPVSLARG